MRPETFPEFVRRGFYESCEDRLALTADPLADVFADDLLGGEIIQHREVAPTLAEAHQATGLTTVRQNYGFRGAGQTVAVIDSGIAYDHQALGQGLGSGYRVVGGWDFTEENDADPYDDGPAGFHGTHVAGIIGSDHSRHTGVAPEVDLVALRVFNDQGQGYFGWVEKALQWVHEHRNAFENPITTVNLSLGTNWNSDTIPDGSILEDEFAQLEADGIFISVSAGNSFQKFNQQAGLSYPAASPHVVPVASVDASGNLSTFSQRNERVLAAPGEFITSSVPDFLFGADGIANDFGSASGTSMAAPYVAGASVLLREAMEFLGTVNITQDTLYDHFYETADVVTDTVTGLNIHRINLERAFDAIMPADEDAAGAAELGTITTSASSEGLIGRLNDTDTFTFTAGQTGRATFSFSPDHGTSTQWQAASGQSISQGQLQFEVVAGQSYTVSVAGDGSLARYAFDAEITSAAVDLGAVSFADFGTLAASGSATYLMSATTTGYFSVIAALNGSAADLQFELYNEQNQVLASGNSSTGSVQLDALLSAGESVYLRVTGNAEFTLRAANLVSMQGSTVTVGGTAGNDTVHFTAGSTHQLLVNGFNYRFSAAEVSKFEVQGASGTDSLVATGTTAAEVATVGSGSMSLESQGYRLEAFGFEEVVVHGGGGADTAKLMGTAGDDVFIATSTTATMRGAEYLHRVNNFSRVGGYASSGHDLAYFHDSAGNDTYSGLSDQAMLYGSGFHNTAYGFDRTVAYATAGGYDLANFFDSTGDDSFSGLADQGLMYGAGYHNWAHGFERVNAYATQGGYDQANLFDSAGNDIYLGLHDHSVMYGSGYYNYVRGFDRVNAFATHGGYDLANFHDSAGNDAFLGLHDHSVMYGAGFYNYARGFDRVNAYATHGGYDWANLYDSAGDDVYLGLHDHSVLYGSGFYNYARGFDRINAYATGGGNDRALFFASQQIDTLVNTAEYTMQYGTNYINYARGFEGIRAAGDANDRAYFFGLEGSDTVVGRGNSLTRERVALSLRYEGTGAYRLYGDQDFEADIQAVDYLYQMVYQ